MTKKGMEQLSVSYRIYHKLRISLEKGLLDVLGALHHEFSPLVIDMLI